ncbi:ATP-binding protein [Streptomyces flavidovirens]|uniref:ATP-binding protein n=1 Tax=Streptomyces flavidovirens TaxID=67298 RepID=UPI000406F5C9|nr:ATP-binding protein [Streptomyces flavidovirens]
MTPARRSAPPACCEPPGGPPSQLLLAGDPQSARAARVYVREFVTHHVPDVSEDHLSDIALVACELVTNAIRYGTAPGDSILVVLSAEPGRTRIEVHDPCRRRPRPKPESEERQRGRGLSIVRVLAARWGVDDRPFGKFVWAEL